jgi:hypothetical protein
MSTLEIGINLFSRIWQAFWTGPWAMVGQELLVIICAALAFVLWLVLIPWRRPNARWLVMHSVLLIAGLLLGLAFLGNELHGRYLVMVTPLLLIPLGAGIARLPLAGLRYLISTLFIALLFIVIVRAQNPVYQHDDARGMVQYYADQLTAEDSVLAWSYADRYELAYYWDRLGVQAQRITLPEGADLDAILPLLPDSGNVALNVWYTQRADFRGMLGCVLGSGTVNLPLEHTVYGMNNLLYESPSLTLPALRPFDGTIFINSTPAASITNVGDFPYAAADRALCLPISLTVNQPMDADLKAAVIARNHLGWEIARADAPFATANQRTTSQLSPGESVTAYPLLRLPYGAPGGDYTVVLRIYDEQRAPSGYDLISTESNFAAKDLPLATWPVSPDADWLAVNRENTLPNQPNIKISENLMLLAHNAAAGDPLPINNGAIIPLTMLWQGSDPLPDLTLAAEDNTWQVVIPAKPSAHDLITLDWRVAQVPLDAAAGLAELRLPDKTVIGHYRVEVLPALFEPPDFEVAVGVEIPGIGTLIGYTLESDSFTIDRPIPVTLIWQAGEITSDVSYTVFVQLLNPENTLIAQSDSVPAQLTRPTNGWRPHEYIIDQHQLQFNENAAPGTATIIVGMYDALTGTRLPITPGGTDFIRLPGRVAIR